MLGKEIDCKIPNLARLGYLDTDRQDLSKSEAGPSQLTNFHLVGLYRQLRIPL